MHIISEKGGKSSPLYSVLYYMTCNFTQGFFFRKNSVRSCAQNILLVLLHVRNDAL